MKTTTTTCDFCKVLIEYGHLFVRSVGIDLAEMGPGMDYQKSPLLAHGSHFCDQECLVLFLEENPEVPVP